MDQAAAHKIGYTLVATCIHTRTHHTHAHTRAHTRTHAHTRIHTHTEIQPISVQITMAQLTKSLSSAHGTIYASPRCKRLYIE